MLNVLAQTDNGGGGAGVAVLFLLYFAFIVAYVAGMWKVYAKAGQPGWAAIVPIYNIYVWTKIAGRPPLWFILALIPCVNIVIVFLLSMDTAKSFGKSEAWGIGLFLLAPIFWIMLGFGKDTYQGPAAAPPVAI